MKKTCKQRKLVITAGIYSILLTLILYSQFTLSEANTQYQLYFQKNWNQHVLLQNKEQIFFEWLQNKKILLELSHNQNAEFQLETVNHSQANMFYLIKNNNLYIENWKANTPEESHGILSVSGLVQNILAFLHEIECTKVNCTITQLEIQKANESRYNLHLYVDYDLHDEQYESTKQIHLPIINTSPAILALYFFSEKPITTAIEHEAMNSQEIQPQQDTPSSELSYIGSIETKNENPANETVFFFRNKADGKILAINSSEYPKADNWIDDRP